MILLEPEKLTKEYIEKLIPNNPIIYNFYNLYYRNSLTWEQALIGMIAHLVYHNEELVKLNIERISLSKNPSFIFKSEKE